MGLNVYFCDVCGVRVTDVDLRSGHGMLRGQDVICATCLEMGHGKEWLAARGGDVARVGAVSAPAVNGGAQAAADNANYKKLVDHARDRAVTVPNEHDVDSHMAHEPHPQDSAHVRQLDHEDTGLVDSIPAEFSGAAVSFAALTRSPTHGGTSGSTGDVAEDISDEIDPLLFVSASPVTLHANDEHLASPYIEKPPEDDDSSALINVAKNMSSGRNKSSSSDAKGRDSTRKSAASSSRVGKLGSPSAASKKSSSNAQNTPVKASSSSSKIGKPKTGRSGKRSVVGGMPMQLKIALITVPLILLIAVVMMVSRAGGAGKAGESKDLKVQQAHILHNFSEAQRLVNDAWISKDVQQMKAADARWKQFMLEWDQFSTDVKKYSHWTDENCFDYWEGLHAPDVNSRTRLLRDEISKQTPH